MPGEPKIEDGFEDACKNIEDVPADDLVNPKDEQQFRKTTRITAGVPPRHLINRIN